MEPLENVGSIFALPVGLIPAEARQALLERAYNGEDVYVYSPVGAQARYNVWDGEAIDPQTGYHGVRTELHEWAAAYMASRQKQEAS